METVTITAPQDQEIDAKEFLLSIEVPATTSTYKPVSYKELIDTTLSSLNICGFKLVKEIYTHSKDGMRANGKYLLEYGYDSEMSLMIAWQNSYDKSLSLKFAVGTWVFICENGCVSGDMGAFKSKHVGEIQQITPDTLREYICRAGESFDKMVAEKEGMKHIQLDTRATAELLGRLFIEEDIITSTQLNTIKREIKTPTYDYKAPGTLWELYNYCTYAIKEDNPRNWMTRQVDIHKFFIDEFRIV